MLTVYRRDTSNSNLYNPVTGSITEIMLPHSNVSEFRCLTEVVTQSFEIRENDLVGACIMDAGGVNPLYLIGDTRDGSANTRLYQNNRSGGQLCGIAQLQAINSVHRNFRLRNRWRLHLSVETGDEML